MAAVSVVRDATAFLVVWQAAPEVVAVAERETAVGDLAAEAVVLAEEAAEWVEVSSAEAQRSIQIRKECSAPQAVAKDLRPTAESGRQTQE